MFRRVKARIWVSSRREWEEITGKFHQWGNSYEEFHEGPANFTIAIIELEDGRIVTAMPTDVQFIE